MSASVGREYGLTRPARTSRGIVYAVSRFLVRHSAHIPVSQQYGETPDGRFFVRVHFSVPPRGVRLTEGLQLAELERDFGTAQCPIGQGISLVGKEAAHE